MNTPDRGMRHVCPECETKYYDLKKAIVTCPKCGAKPTPAKISKSSSSARKN